MDQPNLEEAATALQRYYESKVASDKELRKSACFGESERVFKAFSEGRESIEDEPGNGRPSCSGTDENSGSCTFRSLVDSQNDRKKFDH